VKPTVLVASALAITLAFQPRAELRERSFIKLGDFSPAMTKMAAPIWRLLF